MKAGGPRLGAVLVTSSAGSRPRVDRPKASTETRFAAQYGRPSRRTHSSGNLDSGGLGCHHQVRLATGGSQTVGDVGAGLSPYVTVGCVLICEFC